MITVGTITTASADTKPLEFTHIHDVGANYVILAFSVIGDAGSPSVGRPDFALEEMTLLGSVNDDGSTGCKVFIYGIESTASGSQSVRINFGSFIDGITATCISLFNYDSTGAVTTSNGYQVNAASDGVTTYYDSFVIDALALRDNASGTAPSPTVDSGQTQQANHVNPNGYYRNAVSTKSGVEGTTTLGWTWTGTDIHYAHVVVALQPPINEGFQFHE